MALISLRICAGWSEALLVAYTTLLEIPCHGSFIVKEWSIWHADKKVALKLKTCQFVMLTILLLSFFQYYWRTWRINQCDSQTLLGYLRNNGKMIKYHSKWVKTYEVCQLKDKRSPQYILCMWLFLSRVPLHVNSKHDITMPEKNMEFNLQISYNPIKVSCKFEMLIFKMALSYQTLWTVVFLFVHTVQKTFYQLHKWNIYPYSANKKCIKMISA